MGKNKKKGRGRGGAPTGGSSRQGDDEGESSQHVNLPGRASNPGDSDPPRDNRGGSSTAGSSSERQISDQHGQQLREQGHSSGIPSGGTTGTGTGVWNVPSRGHGLVSGTQSGYSPVQHASPSSALGHSEKQRGGGVSPRGRGHGAYSGACYGNVKNEETKGAYQRARQDSDSYSGPSSSKSSGGMQASSSYSQHGPRRGGGGYRSQPTTRFVDPKFNPDPYEQPFDIKKWFVPGWRPCGEPWTVQKAPNQVAVWNKKEIQVAVNYFQLKSTKSNAPFPIPERFFQYTMDIEIVREREGQAAAASSSGGTPPPKKKLPKALVQTILQTLIPKLSQDYSFYGMVTDNRQYLYATRRLEDVMRNVLSHEISMEEVEHLDEDEKQRGGTAAVVFRPTQLQIDTRAIAAYYRENGSSLSKLFIESDQKQTLEAALNAMVKCFPTYRFVSIGRSTLIRWQEDNVPERNILGGGLVAWKGVSANVTMGWKPYLNVDMANCAFWIGKNALDIMKDIGIWNESTFKPVRTLNSIKVQYKSGTQIFGGTVKGIPKETVSQKEFELEMNGKKQLISVFDYFNQHRNARLKFRNGPLFHLGGTKYVPAEICVIKKGQSVNRLGDEQTAKMLKCAQQEPQDLNADIEAHVGEFRLGQNQVLRELGISIPDKMVQMNARVLVPPEIRYGRRPRGNEVAIASPSEQGVWRAFGNNHEFYKPSQCVMKCGLFAATTNWRQQRLTEKDLKEFYDMLIFEAQRMGMQFPPCPIFEAVQRDFNEFDSSGNLSQLQHTFKTIFKDCQLVIVILPKKNSPLYGHVKHAAEVVTGMLTQCAVLNNVTRPKPSLVQNLLLKINSKLGGINHVTVSPLDKNLAQMFCRLLVECPVLIMGADVTHPAKALGVKGKEFTPSYAAVTGTIDRTCMPFMTELRAQSNPDREAAEVIQNMDVIVSKFLNKFIAVNNRPPWKIIYIRDGVGEGQFPRLLEVEMMAIRRACTAVVGKSYTPKITFITAQKRHKTRIFQVNRDGGIAQAPPGTVIDKEIVHTTETDFYLLSHHGLLGTSRPTRYHVLWDDSEFSPDVIQSMVYTLCYMYCRCTRSVSLPTPTYYAHLAADRARKLCEGFEGQNPSEQSLNEMLQAVSAKMENHPMHFV